MNGAEIAELIREHRLHGATGRCSCGAPSGAPGPEGHVDHVGAVIAAATATDTGSEDTLIGAPGWAEP